MSYVIVHGLDMCLGDCTSKSAKGFNAAVVEAKEFIGKDPSKCATIVQSGGDSYTVYMKNATKTNASSGAAKHSICATVFYGYAC